MSYGRFERVPCITSVRRANICWQGTPIAIISEERNDAGETDWVIAPIWEEYDKYPNSIAGTDKGTRKSEYIFGYGEIPGFINQRVPPKERENIREVLDEIGLDYYDIFEYMCRTHGITGTSPLTVERITKR